MTKVSIAGVGSTRFGRFPDQSIVDLAITAAEQAIAESGIPRARIGALYLGNFVSGPLTGQEVLAGLVGDALGLPNIPCTKVEGACASGGIAFRHACLNVSAGQCDTALAIGVEKMTHARTPETSGLTFPGLFGIAWRLHAARYGTDRRHVSAVIRKNKRNGLRNPLAQMGADLDDDEIAQSPLIADPLRLFDCCPTSDGAAAAVVTRRDHAADNDLAIDVLASAQTRGSARIAGHPDLCTFEATVEAAHRAYAMAGLSAEDIDFAELHDCFSIAEILDAEDLGIVPRGKGHEWALDGRTAVDGDIPINPSGGLLAKGHPVGATGLGQIYEAVLQLRGTHPNQVRDAAIGLTHNLGGAGVACSVTILGRPDA
jgi:acetyl-CoA C-acetyltransferase